ncbi:DUF4767 domain-containing protein [Aerococcaceae bacterium NML180378]|nr:DUF4767 domain-containing protein [Aerococcaceae bacterium NML180378]
MKKKIFLLLLSGLMITGCLVFPTSFDGRAVSEQVNVISIHKSYQDIEWNEARRTSLRDFMVEWGYEMRQAYKFFSLATHGYFFGLGVPEEVMERATVNGESVKLHWAQMYTGDLTSDTVYRIVDCYMTKPHTKTDTHLYFFAIHNGQPVVLHADTKSDIPNVVNFTPSDNQQLQEGFRLIVTSDYSE